MNCHHIFLEIFKTGGCQGGEYYFPLLVSVKEAILITMIYVSFKSWIKCGS